MISSPIFKCFRINEFIQFFSDVVTICEQNNSAIANSEEQYTALKLGLESIEQSFKQKNKSEITKKLIELDSRRDKALVCLNALIEGYQSHFDIKKQEAATSISICINKYGNRLYALNYQAETSVITSMANELIDRQNKALLELNLSSIISELKEANTAFSKAFISRIEETAKDNTESTSELIKTTIPKYRELCKHITAHATITPSEAYSQFINTLNTLIARYNSTMTMRSNVDDSY